jgi:glycine oxidase
VDITGMKSVVIVGGGVIGLFCAVRLAKAGARVTLLEAETEDVSAYGPAASAAAAGMLAPLNEEASPHDKLAFDSLDLWRSLSKGAEWEDAVRFDGGVAVCATGEVAQTLTQRAAAFGRAAWPINASRVRKLTSLRGKLEHTVFVEDEGVCDPVRMISGLAMQARAMGVIIEYSEDAEFVRPDAVSTHEGGLHRADVVVLAPGAWATDELKRAAPALNHVRAGKGHLVPVSLPGPLAPNLRASGFYIAQRREDVVLGATLELDRTDRRVEKERVQELLDAASALLPGEIEQAGQAWAGIRPMSPDGWPMIGPSGDVLVAAGHSRNGWLLAPITAEIITAYVFGAEIPSEWAALSPQRFQD